MSELTTLSNNLDVSKGPCRIVIETPKGCRNKFAYDPDTNLFTLPGLLPEGMIFPFDFGFVPSSLGQDGDPVDIMVLMDAPAHTGCLIDVRIIGIITAEQTETGKTESYNKQRGKKFKITGQGGPKKAVRFLKAECEPIEPLTKKAVRRNHNNEQLTKEN